MCAGDYYTKLWQHLSGGIKDKMSTRRKRECCFINMMHQIQHIHYCDGQSNWSKVPIILGWTLFLDFASLNCFLFPNLEKICRHIEIKGNFWGKTKKSFEEVVVFSLLGQHFNFAGMLKGSNYKFLYEIKVNRETFAKCELC